jgi:hypothetical protein
MKLLILRLLGLTLFLSIISCKSSIKKAGSSIRKSTNKSKKSSTETNSEISQTPDNVAWGYASNENILQNAAVIYV